MQWQFSATHTPSARQWVITGQDVPYVCKNQFNGPRFNFLARRYRAPDVGGVEITFNPITVFIALGRFGFWNHSKRLNWLLSGSARDKEKSAAGGGAAADFRPKYIRAPFKYSLLLQKIRPRELIDDSCMYKRISMERKLKQVRIKSIKYFEHFDRERYHNNEVCARLLFLPCFLYVRTITFILIT